MSLCHQVFADEGRPLEVAGNAPLVLNDPGSVWLVESGHVDVFSVTRSTREGIASADRSHLCRVATGDLLVGATDCGDGRSALIATGIPGSKVRRLPLARLQELAADPSTAPQVASLLDHWIEALTRGAGRGRMPGNTTLLEPAARIDLKADSAASPARTLWIETADDASGTDASCRFLGSARLPLSGRNGVFPLAGSGWIDIDRATSLHAAETESLQTDSRLWSGLQQFHQLVIQCAAANAAEAAAAEIQRLERKLESDEEQTAAALAELAASVEPDRARDVVTSPGEDPLLTACRLVAKPLGLSIRAPRSFGKRELSDPVSAIARASGVRTRRVVLTGRWWREDNGPLLAFLAEEDRAVALLPARGGYDLLDPQTGARTTVTPEVRNRLQGSAWSFYRSFPSRALRLRDVLRFALFGTRREWTAIVLLGVAAAVLGLLVPIATGWIVGHIIPGAERFQLLVLVLVLSVNALVIALFEYSQGIASLRLEARMDSSVEAGVWDRLLNLPVSFFRKYTSGDLAMRAMGIGHIRQMLTDTAVSSLLSFVFSLVAFALLFYYDVRLAIVASLLFLAVVTVTAVAVSVQLPLERRQYEIRGEVAGLLLQILTGIARLRVAGAENRALVHWARHYSRQVKATYRAQRISNALAAFMAAVPVFATLVIFAAVTLFPTEGLTLATFLAFSAAYAIIMGAAIDMSSAITSVLDVVPLYERSRPILETPPEFYHARGEPGRLSGAIEVSHVSFRYQADGPLVLDDVSFDIRPGEFVAFVGPSGAGKSTILRLLLGFETPETGSIYFDREDLSQLDRQAVRRQIGVVFQNSRLMSGDIFRNIVGSAPLTLDDAWEAARISGLDQEIRQMPMGMHTVISEGESTFSGGQRQRLLIARAIVTRPKILLFDEATSALDNVTQAKVAQSLEALKATRVVVAHRLSTIVNADRICVIEGGRIVQQGKYDQLLAQPGLFAELAKRQLL